MNLQEAAAKLDKPEEFVIGLGRAGLLGKVDGLNYDHVGIENFINYGCQWKEDGRIQIDTHIKELPPFVQADVVHGGPEKTSQFWIGLGFYVPNPNYHLPVNALTCTTGTGIKMAKPLSYQYGNYAAFLFPTPTGALGTVLVMSLDNTPMTYAQIFPEYSRIIQRITSEISFRCDRYLRVVHSAMIALPTGKFFFETDNFPLEQNLDDLGLVYTGPLPDELLESKILYWEAMNAYDPFMRFLLFYKSYELSTSMLKHIRKQRTGKVNDTRLDCFIFPEAFPDKFPFGSHAGKKFSAVFEEMRASYRNAIAHVGLDHHKPLRASLVEDRRLVKSVTAAMHYMAKVRISNVEYMLAPEEVRNEMGPWPPVSWPTQEASS